MQGSSPGVTMGNYQGSAIYDWMCCKDGLCGGCMALTNSCNIAATLNCTQSAQYLPVTTTCSLSVDGSKDGLTYEADCYTGGTDGTLTLNNDGSFSCVYHNSAYGYPSGYETREASLTIKKSGCNTNTLLFYETKLYKPAAQTESEIDSSRANYICHPDNTNCAKDTCHDVYCFDGCSKIKGTKNCETLNN
jgi:hypothetical protein